MKFFLSILFALAINGFSHLAFAAEVPQVNAYKVEYVDNDGEPSNVKYAIFKEEGDRLIITQRGTISPDMELPINCFVCVNEEAEFVMRVGKDSRLIEGSSVGYLKDFIEQNKDRIKPNSELHIHVEEGAVSVEFLAPDGKKVMAPIAIQGERKGTKASSEATFSTNLYLDSICGVPKEKLTLPKSVGSNVTPEPEAAESSQIPDNPASPS